MNQEIQTLENTKKGTLPYSLQKECNPAAILYLDQCYHSEQNSCCFKQLNLGQCYSISRKLMQWDYKLYLKLYFF
jgi:hypothetical protein